MTNDARLRATLEAYEPYLLISPAVIWYVVFLLFPLGVIAVYSFLTYQSFSVAYEFTLASWTGILSDATTYDVLLSTFVTALATTLLTVLLGYPVAYYMRFYLSQLTGMFILLFLVVVFWTSPIIRATGWYPILGRQGVVNDALLALGLVQEPLSWLLYSEFSALVGYMQNYLLFMAAPIYIALFRIDEDLLKASETLRATPLQTFRHVVWPQSLPGVVIGFIFVFIMAAGDLIVPEFLGRSGSKLTSLVYGQVSTTNHYPNAAVLSIILLVVILLTVALLVRRVSITDLYDI